MQHIESFGGDSSVLVVINKFDENPGYNINRPFLQKKYKSIKGFYRVSCASCYGIDDFKEALTEELAQTKLIETRWANSWFKVKQQLETLEQHYISYETYERICKDSDISEPISQEVLVDFLHDLGVVLHFRELDLEDIHVLDPRWVTGAVYRIVNSEALALNNGELSIRTLRDVLKKRDDDDFEYPREKHRYIVGIMKKFELCYDLDPETVLIPQLLDVVEPDLDFDEEDALRFVLKYDFLSYRKV